MNGFFIFNLAMLVWCFFNAVTVSRSAYGSVWLSLVVWLAFVVVAITTALSYGSGPLSGS